MTISSADRIAGPFTGNDIAVSFPFAYKVFAGADVIAILSNGVTETTLVLDSDYTVALNGDQNANPGGTVSYPMVGIPMPVTYTLTLSSDLTELQPTSLSNIENAFDRAIILLQQLRGTVAAALDPDIDERHLRVLPLRPDPALLVDDHEAAVVLEAAVGDGRLVHGDAARGFDWIEKEIADGDCVHDGSCLT